MATDTAKEVLAAWETSSQYWTKHQSLIASMFAPLTDALVDAARIGLGQSVLDVGGGSGEPSLTIAPIVGQSGSVTYTDPSAGMVNAARDEADRRGLTNIRFHQCSAEQLPFPDNIFDGAVSRLAAMFFPDPTAGLREILRVIKPGANLSFVVWADKEVNPFFRIVTDILEKFIPVEAEDEDAPAAFRFATPGKLTTLLTGAGATSVTERTLKFKIEAPINPERFWELRTEMSDTFRSKLAQLELDQVAAIRETVQQGVAIYFKDDAMSFPAQALIVSGLKQ
ncbi:MAG: methyltransferase domain-containing protein [bacterium]